jgi:hypothetical protein
MAADKLPQKAKIVGGTITGATLSGCTINADDLTAPSVVSGVSATAKPLHVRLKWTNPTELDFSHVEIYRHTADVSGSASVIARTKADIYRDHDGTLATTYWYWAKTVDVAGNKSAFVALGNAAPATVAVATETNAGTAAQKNTGTEGDTVPLLNGNNAYSGVNDFTEALVVSGTLKFIDSPFAKQIASGAITVSEGDSSRIFLTGEGGVADDLVTINVSNMSGGIIILQPSSDTVDITLKHGTGNIFLPGAADFVLNNLKDVAVLMYQSGMGWLGLCVANNS